ncbi:hypothetical protein CPC08DRAFT_712526 [Agrocybe pediades]|nr:hypothetical protein CPC08DRAFT_712526 [Agrocybe pediades]
MSSPSNFPFSVVQQKAFIGSALHSTMLLQFLFGIYTGVFPCTIYIYSHRENSTVRTDKIVIGSITALYTVIVSQVLLNWFYTGIIFCAKGETRLHMFIENVTLEALPTGVRLSITILNVCGFAFADGLLVWRCFHACGRSFWRSSLPIALFFVEIVLIILSTTYECMLLTRPGFDTPLMLRVKTYANAAMFVSVPATSLISTIIICRQIYAHALPGCRSWKRYRTIINALVESSGLYSAPVVFMAVLDLMGTGQIQSSFTPEMISLYVNVIVVITAGLGPTGMIAQLFLTSGLEDSERSSISLPSEHISRPSLTNNEPRINSEGGDNKTGQQSSYLGG